MTELATIDTKAPAINTIAGRGGIVTLRRNLRSAIRGLWTGALSRQQAITVFRRAMENGIEQAWVEGAAECGIQPDELTIEELTARDEFIFNQNDLADNFIDSVVEQSKLGGGGVIAAPATGGDVGQSI